MIYVFQYSDRLWPEDRLAVMLGYKKDHSQTCAEIMATGGYDMVAKLNQSESLEEAFLLTNSIDENWFEPELLEMHNIRATGEYRSTSVGDIMLLIEGDVATFYVVSSIGFRDITDLLWMALEDEENDLVHVVTCPTAQVELENLRPKIG